MCASGGLAISRALFLFRVRNGIRVDLDARIRQAGLRTPGGNMKRVVIIGVALAAAFAAGAAAQSSSPWRVFATGTDSGDYGAFASASGDVAKPKGLAARVQFHGASSADLSYNLICEGEIKTARSGVTYLIQVPTMKKCSVDGSANTDSGSLTIQLLKR
jgi:hypothetical protein